MSDIAIIDYGMGNLYSVRNTFAALGLATDIIDSGKNIMAYQKLILPGVGAFGDAMKELNRKGLTEAIKDFVSQGRPFLGICLGMQLLLDHSEESPRTKGLGIIPGIVKRFSGNLKVPHMGWNKIQVKKKGSLFKAMPREIYTYFCHSYYVAPKDKSAVAGETEYGRRFASIVEKDRVYGMQFHPEKSQDTGLQLLRNFIELC